MAAASETSLVGIPKICTRTFTRINKTDVYGLTATFRHSFFRVSEDLFYSLLSLRRGTSLVSSYDNDQGNSGASETESILFV